MLCVCPIQALRVHYPAHADAMLAAIDQLGTLVDVSGMHRLQIRDQIDARPGQPVCLIGGPDLIPPFWRVNPTYGTTEDPDPWVATDAPYGAKPGADFVYEEYAPSRALSRIPEPRPGDGASFLSLLQQQLAVPATPTPAGSFELAAAEFAGAQAQVRAVMDPTAVPGPPSPPLNQHLPGLTARISHRGRLHVALHGVRSAVGWDTLLGRKGEDHPFVPALTATQLGQCRLQGMVATFSACYAGMLDRGEDATPGVPVREVSNQVALACLSAGAKVVFASTRANWIDIQPPYDSFGPALTAEIWRHLADGHGAAEALRRAKWTYIRSALESDRETLPFVQKTVLQAHCYGHAMASL